MEYVYIRGCPIRGTGGCTVCMRHHRGSLLHTYMYINVSNQECISFIIHSWSSGLYPSLYSRYNLNISVHRPSSVYTARVVLVHCPSAVSQMLWEA